MQICSFKEQKEPQFIEGKSIKARKGVSIITGIPNTVSMFHRPCIPIEQEHGTREVEDIRRGVLDEIDHFIQLFFMTYHRKSITKISTKFLIKRCLFEMPKLTGQSVFNENIISHPRILKLDMTDEEWEDLLNNDDNLEIRQALVDGRFDLLGIDTED